LLDENRPNGGLIYCMKFIEDNISWLIERISKHKNKYLIFDLPGIETNRAVVIWAEGVLIDACFY